MIDAVAERNTREFSFETCVTSSKAEDPKPLYPRKLLTLQHRTMREDESRCDGRCAQAGYRATVHVFYQ
jgi:hypothetical protein